MDDKEKKSSWDALLDEVGAQPDDAAFERHQPASQEIPATPETETQPVERSPSDWNSLADALGIEIDDVAEEPAATEGTIEGETQDEPAVEPARVGGFLAEAVDEAKEAADENEARSTADDFSDLPEFGIVESADETDDSDTIEADELPPLPESADEAIIQSDWDDEQEQEQHDAANESTDTAGGGISGEAARSAFDALFADGASGWGSAFLSEPKPVDDKGEITESWGGEFAEKVDKTESDDGDDDAEGDRPKRRRSRRRRGGRGRKSSDASVGDETTVNADADADSEESSDDGEEKKRSRRRRSRGRGRRRDGEETVDDRSADESADEFGGELAGGDENDDDDSQRTASTARGRQRHRNLPTWSEAIGMIVDSNLEQRSKTSSKPQSSRGGRGRGRRRGGSRKTNGK